MAKKQLSIIVDNQLDCGMENSVQACSNHRNSNNVRNHCCSNEVIHLSIDGDFESPLVTERKHASNTFAMFNSLAKYKTHLNLVTVDYTTYHPPTLEFDIPVMIQCFLI